MMTISSLALMLLAVVIIALSCKHPPAGRALGTDAHRRICVAVFALGCLARLWRLGSLPAGLCAEESLVAAQGKALWQTGGFLFGGRLTAQLAQWTGESSGPLLATLTAPFVGILGISPWTTRLPLALLSCAAMPAAYGLGKELSGERAGRWCLAAYALCPYFVLGARMTCGANAAVCMLPIAMFLLVRGLRKPALLYAGAAVMGLTAYTQDMYFFIAPAVIVLSAVLAAAYGGKKRHALAAAALGLAVCAPALLTLWVNLTGREGFVLLGAVEIPRLEQFDKAQSLFDRIPQDAAAVPYIRDQVWAVIVGGFAQVLWHDNISMSLLAPDGFGALYFISLPLMLLGMFSLLHRRLSGERAQRDRRPGRALVIGAALITLFFLTLYGSEGMLNVNGTTSVYDYSALFLYDALLMTAGLCCVERYSRAGGGAAAALLGVQFAMLCLFITVGSYQSGANVYFQGIAQAIARADALHEETGAKMNVTTAIYPHIRPGEAAEMMTLAASDMDGALEARTQYEIIYAPGVQPDPQQIYVVTYDDCMQWDLEPFRFEEVGGYVVLSPQEEP